MRTVWEGNSTGVTEHISPNAKEKKHPSIWEQLDIRNREGGKKTQNISGTVFDWDGVNFFTVVV